MNIDVRASLAGALVLVAFAGSTMKGSDTNAAQLREHGAKYTAAWCSQDPARVAEFYAEGGSLKVNDGAPAVGRKAITEVARGFMTGFPDMVVRMDGIDVDGGRIIYRWTLTGTNTGPGGTGNPVHIRGYEEWTLDGDGRITESKGHFDQAEYRRQLQGEAARASAPDAALQSAMAERQRANREGDTAAIEALMVSEYVQTDIGGRIQDRDEWLASYFKPLADLIRSGRFHWETWEETAVQTRVFGDTAIAVGKLTLAGTGATIEPGRGWVASSGARFGPATLSFTRVWIRRDGKWLLAAVHNALPQQTK